MAIIHLNTDAFYEQGKALLRLSTDMHDRIRSLKYDARLLDAAWEGQDASSLIDELDQVILQIESHIHLLDELSNRVVQEVEQWLSTDAVERSFTDYFGNTSLSWDDTKLLFAGGYLATHLRWTPLRPNSMVFTGPNWMRKTVGIKEMTRVIKPRTLVKQMALLSYLSDIGEGIGAGRDSFLDPHYIGTSRAFPAALVDGMVKTAILAAGTTALVVATAAITTISAPAVIVGGAVIATWVVGGFVLDKVIQTPVWESWQKSYTREKVIEGGARVINEVGNYIQYQVQSDVQAVKLTFGGFINSLSIPSE